MDSIRVKRGLKQELPSSLPIGELAFCTDTRELYVGMGDNLPLKKVVDREVIEQCQELSSQLEQIEKKEEISVTDFGAKGDGVTDDTEAIQRAFDSVSNFQSIVIPKGTYICTSLILKKSDIKLKCIGRLKQKQGYVGDLLTIQGNNNYIENPIVIRDCTTEGTALEDLVGTGIKITECKNIIIMNPKSHNFGIGIEIHSDVGGCAYIDIYNPNILAGVGLKSTGTSWKNEVHVFGGRFVIYGTYDDYTGTSYCNLNGDCYRFNSVCLEGENPQRKITGYYAYSSFIGCRFEGVCSSGVDIDINGDFNLFVSNRDTGLKINNIGKGNNILDYATYKFGSAISTGIKNVTSNYELTWAEQTLIADASNGNININTQFPTDAYSKGVEYTVKKVDDTINTVYVFFRGSLQDKDMFGEIVLKRKNESITFVSDGEKWHIKNWFKPQRKFDIFENKNDKIEAAGRDSEFEKAMIYLNDDIGVCTGVFRVTGEITKNEVLFTLSEQLIPKGASFIQCFHMDNASPIALSITKEGNIICKSNSIPAGFYKLNGDYLLKN